MRFLRHVFDAFAEGQQYSKNKIRKYRSVEQK
jgi:hypothetical protein